LASPTRANFLPPGLPGVGRPGVAACDGCMAYVACRWWTSSPCLYYFLLCEALRFRARARRSRKALRPILALRSTARVGIYVQETVRNCVSLCCPQQHVAINPTYLFKECCASASGRSVTDLRQRDPQPPEPQRARRSLRAPHAPCVPDQRPTVAVAAINGQ
jgi:hypothetical protein